MARTYLALIASLLLVACQDSPESNSGINNDAIAVDEPDVDHGTQDELPEGPPSAANGGIPVAFQGRWALVPADCGSDMSVAKGLLTITGGMLRFYESVGTPEKIRTSTPSRIEGRFSFSGEGMDWAKDMTLSLESRGSRLVRSERDPTISYSYTRCPR